MPSTGHLTLVVDHNPDACAYRRVWSWLEDQGWEVREGDLVAEMGPEEEFTTGIAMSGTTTVIINTFRPRTLVQKLHTLVHEAGHVLSHVRGFSWHTDVETCELRAHLYGWAVAKHFGIGSITKSSWRRFNYQYPQPKALAA